MARLSLAEVGLLLLLVVALVLSAEASEKRLKTLRRKKREWIIPPCLIKENHDYTKKPFIAKIRSDKDSTERVQYQLSGPGADKPPFNLFVVNHETGFVRINGILDREKKASYNLTGKAIYMDGNKAEEDIPLIVKVLDENDNAPYFKLHTGNVIELSKKGSFVMQIEGKDDDQEGTINSEISYKIISQEPEGSARMFHLESKTGKLYVNDAGLDRETCDYYKLVVQGSDLGGAAGGLTGTGTVEIKVLDINDNKPILEKSEYEGSVDENVADVIVMRIKALDADLEPTDNWKTVFKIVKGNEDDLFTIETDEKTNEGILKLVKPVDFEELQKLALGLSIENVAPFVEGGAVEMDVDVQVGQGGPVVTGAGVEAGADVNAGVDLHAGVDMGVDGGVEAGVGLGLDAGLKPGAGVRTTPKQDAPEKTYSILISVNNMPEGPAFRPDTKIVPVSEDPNELPKDGVLTSFPAIDPDTGKQAEDVSYAKAYDPDNWFTIDEETAEIKLNKAPDRESPFLVNGTYIAKILAISEDVPSKTATGTIAIQVADSNDHCPTLTTSRSSLCSDSKTVNVTGIDEDVSPNAAPFSFEIIPDGTRGKWEIKRINDTSAALHSHEMLWPGEYKLQVKVTDNKGLSCSASEPFILEVCDCVEGEGCDARTAKQGAPSSELSASAIGLLLMALCLLLLIPLLLLLCQCGGADTIFPDQFSDIPFDAKEHLISYHTEGRGEDKEVPLQSVPIMMGTQKKVEAAAAAANFNSAASKITETHQTSEFYDESVQQFLDTRQRLTEVDNAYGLSRESFNNSSVVYGRPTLGVQRSTTAFYDDMALPNSFLNEYYSQKAECAVPVKDSLMDYGFEGQGSPTGSLGCCSLLESDDDLQFLNDLGSKFKTLAEICSPPTPTPKPSLTHKVTGGVKASVDIVEPVVRPKIEHNVETRHTDIKTEKVMSSTNISKSSVSTMSTAPQSMTLPRTNNTNISQSSNISHSSYISHSATLPRQAQTVILQQQPVYYATSPVLQPMHYVVQPQLQNTVLLANEAQGSNVPGFYVVSGPQNPSSGLVISGPPRSPSGLVIQGIGSPKSPASPASPVSPTLLLPGSPGVSQGTVPGEGWKMVGPNPDGNYMLVMDKSSPGEAEGVDPGSSQGTLPRGAILVKEAAPPQGVLGPAAQGSVYGILPGHTVVKNGGVVAVNSNLGQTWVGQPGQMGLRPVNILGVGAGQPRMGHVVTVKPEGRHTGIWPPGINSVGIRQISVNQSQGIPPMEQTRDPSGIPKEYRIESPKEDKTTSVVNTVITTDIITAEAVKTNQSPKEEVMTKKLDDSDPTQNMRTDTVEEQQDVISKASEHDPALNDEEPREVVQEYQTQTSEKSSIADLEEDIVKSLPGSEVMQTSFEQSDTVVEKLGDTTDEIVPDQLNKITQAPTNTFTDVESPTAEASDPQQNIEEEAEAPQAGQQENLGPAEGYSKEDVFMVTEMSSTEALRRGSDVSDLGNTDEKGEETTAFHQGEEATSTSDHLNIVDDQIHDSAEENVGRQEAAPLKEEEVEEEGEPVQLSTVAAPDDRSAEVESESQSNQVSEDQSDRDLEQDVSPAEEVVSALETNQVIATSDSVQAEEIMEERTTVTSDTHEDVMAKQEQMLDSDVELDTVDAHLLATAPNEISMDTMIVSEERSIPDQEAMPELEVDRSEGFQIGEGHAQRDIVDAEARTSLQTGSIILANQEEGDLGDSNLISASEEITTQVQAEGSTVPTISTLEQHVQIAEDEDDDDQQRITSESGEDKDQVSADTDSVSDGEKEGSIVEEGVSQQSFSTSDDQDEDIERQDGLSTSSQLEENFISDDNTSNEEKDEDAVEETVSPVQQNISSSDDQDEKSAKEDASSTSSQVDDTVMSDDNINGSEKEEGETLQDVTLPIQQNVSITHYQDEEIEGEDVSGRGSSLEDQLAAGDDIDTVETEDHIAEKVTSPIQPLLSITNDQDEEIGRADAGHATSTVEDQLISEDDTGDGAQEVSPVEQTTLSSDEDTQREYAPETVSQVETKLISDVHGEKEEIEAPSIHQNICISGDQDEDSEEEGAPGTSSHIQEEGIKSYQLSEEESQPLDTECLSAMSKVTDTQEMPSEITTHQVRRGLVSSQTGEIPLDIAERHILVRDANMEGLDDVVTSSGELMSSRVATGQVYMSSEDKGVGDSILASGQSAGGDLTLEKGNVEATFDPEIREGLDGSITHASGQVLPISSSEIEVVGKTISSTLETDPGSAEIGTASFIATSEVAEEAGDLVQNESVHITGEAAEIGPNTVGNAVSIDVESKVSDYMHGAEASGGEVSPVQTVISQTRNKFRRSKKDSSKKPQSPKSPSGKCKQQ